MKLYILKAWFVIVTALYFPILYSLRFDQWLVHLHLAACRKFSKYIKSLLNKLEP